MVLFAGAALAAPPTLPPGATPGGAAPEFIQVPIPEETEPLVFPIPPAVERPLGVEEGERVFVRRFEIQGVVDRPEHGIRKAELEALLERLRVEREGLTEVGKDGFTDEERAQVVEFMRKVVNDRDLDMKFEDYQAMVDRLRLEKLEREAGMTVGQMQAVADELTQYYRRAGFVLAQAFVPAQEVKDGVVRLEVMEGKLGQVVVEGNERYSNELLARPFTELTDAPVMRDSMEEGLLLLSEYPGLNAFGVLQPGQSLGTTDLVIKVQDEKRFTGDVTFNNAGTRLTGEYRLSANVTFNSPLLSGDRLTLQGTRSYFGKNAIVGGGSYEIPLFGPKTSVGLSYSRNDFDVGKELRSQDIAGSTEQGSVYATHIFRRSREKNLRARFGVTRKQALTFQRRVLQAKDDLTFAGLEVSFDNIDKAAQAINAGTIRIDRGVPELLGAMSKNDAEGLGGNDVPSSRRTRDGQQVDAKYTKLTVGLARVKKLSNAQTLLMRVNGQYSPDPLLSVEQFALGGPDSVRAYPVSEFLMDSGIFASVDWSIRAPSDMPAYGGKTWGDILTLSFFADYARGWLHKARDDEKDNANLFGVGLGLKVLFPGEVLANFQLAYPIGDEFQQGLGGSSNGRRSQFWFDLRYHF